MKGHLLLFLKTPELEFRKKAFAFLRQRQICVLAQYGSIAFEVSLAGHRKKVLSKSDLFSQIYDARISSEAIAQLSADARDIATAWNLSFDTGLRRRKAAHPGLSWNAEGFDEPRPYSELSKEFVVEMLQNKRFKLIEPTAGTDLRFDRKRANVASAK
jgi:hypothetical protein